MRELSEFKLNKSEVIAIVGTGGKTTLMMRLAEELSKDSKILMAASTIYRPPVVKSPMLVSRSVREILDSTGDYSLFAYSHERDDGRYGGITEDEVEKFQAGIDYIIMEADGSKMMPYKGWRDFEPVILDNITMTIGILPLSHYNMTLEKDNIFNYNIFVEDFGSVRLTKETIYKIVTDDRGMFKNALGRKFLYLTQWDHLEKSQLEELIQYLKENIEDIEIVLGSYYKRGPRV